MWTEHRFISFDETPIFYRHWKTEGSCKGIVVILHGMGEHGGRYQHVAEYLAGLGLESVVPDLRGFGKSGGKRACVNRFSDYHKDLAGLHAFIARNHREAPLFLLGHSFGGLITSSYLAFCEHPKINGLVLSSPIFGIALQVSHWRHILGVITSYLMPTFSQPTNVVPKILTHDKRVLEEYQKDTLIYHKVSARIYVELVSMLGKKIAIAERIADPVLVVQAGEDYVVSKEETLRFYDHLKSNDKEIEVYKDFYHEVLNEVDRQMVFSKIGLWILRHLERN